MVSIESVRRMVSAVVVCAVRESDRHTHPQKKRICFFIIILYSIDY